MSKVYLVTDENGPEVEIEAASRAIAAKIYVLDSNYYPSDETFWVTVYVTKDDERTQHKVAMHPASPECSSSQGHKWHSPYAIVGGIKENPGVWGHGGGVICKEVCRHCGVMRITDTWAQDMSDGEQGLTSISYESCECV